MSCRKILIALITLCPAILWAGLEFEATELDLEVGLMDDSVEAVFRFKNTGDKAVSISEPKSSCGCTVPTLEKTVYAPGEEGEIKALFTIGGRTGKQHKSVSLKTDDPKNSTVLLSFNTTIPEWCTITPRLLRWEVSSEIAGLEMTVTVADPERVKVELQSREMKHFTMSEVSSTGGKQVFLITPKSTVTRVTEKLSFTMTATDGDITRSRETPIYCLIR